MSRYQNITAAEMRDFLKVSKGWKEVGFDLSGTKEIVFEYPLKKYPFLVIKVCSGIKVGDEQSRDCGKDAIRVFAINTNTNKGWISTKRTYRTTGWKENLQTNILGCINEAENRVKQYEAQKAAQKPPQVNRYQQNPINLSPSELAAEMEVFKIESRQK